MSEVLSFFLEHRISSSRWPHVSNGCRHGDGRNSAPSGQIVIVPEKYKPGAKEKEQGERKPHDDGFMLRVTLTVLGSWPDSLEKGDEVKERDTHASPNDGPDDQLHRPKDNGLGNGSCTEEQIDDEACCPHAKTHLKADSGQHQAQRPLSFSQPAVLQLDDLNRDNCW